MMTKKEDNCQSIILAALNMPDLERNATAFWPGAAQTNPNHYGIIFPVTQRAQMPCYNPEWEPSQKGMLFECLQAHHATDPG